MHFQIISSKDFLIDSLNYSLKSFDKKFSKTDYLNGFLRYEKYERRYPQNFNWPKKPVAQNVGGYKSPTIKKTVLFCYI